MFENKNSLFPIPPRDDRHHGKLSVISVGFEDLGEMDRLLETLGVQVLERVLVPLRKIQAGTYLGSGKVEEIRVMTEAQGAHAVVIDADLSPNQTKNLEKIFNIPVLDRAGVILEIFSQHARTKEAKTQVELARVEYMLPRLSHLWSHFERQRGGSVGLRGMGEKQLEVDRRLLQKRISLLKERLKTIEKERDVQRSGRREVLKVALMGYTNAGKSTLLNALTHSQVLAEDKLFATLDASVRALSPDSHPPVVAIDTVGFIDRIPTSLVASFRSTLEELHQADLLVHVVDASSLQAREHIQVTENLLKELGLEDKPRMLVLNKYDLVKNAGPGAQAFARTSAPGAIRVSALHSEEVKALREKIMEFFQKGLDVWEVMIPYAESKLDSQIRALGIIDKEKPLDQGMFYRIRMESRWAKRLELHRYQI